MERTLEFAVNMVYHLRKCRGEVWSVKLINHEREIFNEESYKYETNKFLEMLSDFDLKQEDYYAAFENMCIKYNESSLIPYQVLQFLVFEIEAPMEEYYLQALMEVYCMHAVNYTFLEALRNILELNYQTKYLEKVKKLIESHLQHGYIIAYRGEYKGDNNENLDYKESVSYTLDYNEAKFFATRFQNIFTLEKSRVYTVRVPLDDIIGYNDREQEIVCIPISIGGRMEIIKTDDFV